MTRLPDYPPTVYRTVFGRGTALRRPLDSGQWTLIVGFEWMVEFNLNELLWMNHSGRVPFYVYASVPLYI